MMRDLINIVETKLVELAPYKASDEYQSLKGVLSEPVPADASKGMFYLRKIREYFESKGFKYMAEGNRSVLFTHPGLNYIVKVFKADPAYQLFVDYCFTHRGAAAIPKITGKVIKILDLGIVRMEKLAPCTDARAFAVAKDFIVSKHDATSFYEKILDPKLKPFAEENPSFLPVLQDLKALRKAENMNFDLTNRSNIMQREDGTAVIIDPFIAPMARFG